MPHPEVKEFLRVKSEELVEAIHFGYQLIDCRKGLAGLQGKRYTMTEKDYSVRRLKADVELQFLPATMKEGKLPSFGGRKRTENVAARPSLKPLQLFTKRLQSANPVVDRTKIEFVNDLSEYRMLYH